MPYPLQDSVPSAAGKAPAWAAAWLRHGWNFEHMNTKHRDSSKHQRYPLQDRVPHTVPMITRLCPPPRRLLLVRPPHPLQDTAPHIARHCPTHYESAPQPIRRLCVNSLSTICQQFVNSLSTICEQLRIRNLKIWKPTGLDRQNSKMWKFETTLSNFQIFEFCRSRPVDFQIFKFSNS